MTIKTSKTVNSRSYKLMFYLVMSTKPANCVSHSIYVGSRMSTGDYLPVIPEKYSHYSKSLIILLYNYYVLIKETLEIFIGLLDVMMSVKVVDQIKTSFNYTIRAAGRCGWHLSLGHNCYGSNITILDFIFDIFIKNNV